MSEELQDYIDSEIARMTEAKDKIRRSSKVEWYHLGYIDALEKLKEVYKNENNKVS